MVDTPDRLELAAETPEGKGFRESVAGFVLGVVSLLLSLLPFAGLVCGIVGLVLSAKGVRHTQVFRVQRGLGLAGYIMCIVGIIWSTLATTIWILAVTVGASFMQNWMPQCMPAR